MVTPTKNGRPHKYTRKELYEWLDDPKDWFFHSDMERDYELPSDETIEAAREMVNMICNFNEDLADDTDMGPEDDGIIEITVMKKMPDNNSYRMFLMTVGRGTKVVINLVPGWGDSWERMEYEWPSPGDVDVARFLEIMRKYDA